MRRIIFAATLTLITLSYYSLHAQVPNVSSNHVNAGSLVTQFAKAIKPSSFLSSWTSGKSGWLGKAGKITDAAGMASSISSLAGFIKPGMFKSGFNVQNLMQAAGSAKSMADATGLLKNLEGGLKPEAMSSEWGAKKSSWESALQLLK
ncbi:MAG: hypothetical protein E6H10_00525 [Bacteroidetes bacterium]|nr:MAG: hypothetical protein E6H10_00525 [Bacteroidota bacterium]